jgi:hypothetical protein
LDGNGASHKFSVYGYHYVVACGDFYIVGGLQNGSGDYNGAHFRKNNLQTSQSNQRKNAQTSYKLL